MSKIEIEPYAPIPEGYEVDGWISDKTQFGTSYLAPDGSVKQLSLDGHKFVYTGRLLALRRKLYAPIPEGYVEDGWIENGSHVTEGTPYLSISGGVFYVDRTGSWNRIASGPRIRLRKKTRKATVLTARVVLPEGHTKAYSTGKTISCGPRGVPVGGLEHEFTWTETTEEVPA